MQQQLPRSIVEPKMHRMASGLAQEKPGTQNPALAEKIEELNERVNFLFEKNKDKNSWKKPNDVELARFRPQFKNIYGYAVDFMSEYDLFNENRDDSRNSSQSKFKIRSNSALYIGGDSQSNITPAQDSKAALDHAENDISSRLVLAEQHAVEPEDKFTPIMAHRYLQK